MIVVPESIGQELRTVLTSWQAKDCVHLFECAFKVLLVVSHEQRQIEHDKVYEAFQHVDSVQLKQAYESMCVLVAECTKCNASPEKFRQVAYYSLVTDWINF